MLGAVTTNSNAGGTDSTGSSGGHSRGAQVPSPGVRCLLSAMVAMGMRLPSGKHFFFFQEKLGIGCLCEIQIFTC